MSAVKERLRGTVVEAADRLLRDRRRQSRIHAAVLARRRARAVAEWQASERVGAPPPEVKQSIVLEAGKRHGLRTLVETGTYLGGTVLAGLWRFDRIVSIELDWALAENARRTFAHAGNVTILQGDSGVLVAQILQTLRVPALWWLDGHYSGPGTALGASTSPVLDELRAIMAHDVRGHVVLIDDARLFTGSDYPTLDEVREFVAPRFAFTVADDVIRLVEHTG